MINWIVVPHHGSLSLLMGWFSSALLYNRTMLECKSYAVGDERRGAVGYGMPTVAYTRAGVGMIAQEG